MDVDFIGFGYLKNEKAKGRSAQPISKFYGIPPHLESPIIFQGNYFALPKFS